MNYCIINNENRIENIIVSDESFANSIGALPMYDGAKIGDVYSPPIPEPEPSQLDIIEAQVTYTAMMTDTLLEG